MRAYSSLNSSASEPKARMEKRAWGPLPRRQAAEPWQSTTHMTLAHNYLSSEEFHQHGSKGFRGDFVRLTLKLAMCSMGNGLCQCYRRRMHEWERGRAIHDERWHGDAGGFFGGDRVIIAHSS